MLHSRAIILMNAFRKWGALPSDKMICDKDDKQFEKWHHQTTDLYILEMGNLRSLSTGNRKLWGSFTLSQDSIFRKKIIIFC